MGLRDRGRTGHMRIILIRNYPFIFIIKPPVYPSFFYLDVNECLINGICKNGGTCINTHGGYRCQCLSGYQGKHCEQGTKNPVTNVMPAVYRITLMNTITYTIEEHFCFLSGVTSLFEQIFR